MPGKGLGVPSRDRPVGLRWEPPEHTRASSAGERGQRCVRGGQRTGLSPPLPGLLLLVISGIRRESLGSLPPSEIVRPMPAVGACLPQKPLLMSVSSSRCRAESKHLILLAASPGLVLE